MDESTGDSRDEEGVGNLELDGVVDLLVLGSEHGSELLSLRNGSGESIEDESVAAQRAQKRESAKVMRERNGGREERTNPSWHSLFSSSCFLIMLTMISSGTSPPCRFDGKVSLGKKNEAKKRTRGRTWSMIFFAETPRGVLLVTSSLSMSPVARWQTENFSLIVGA